nr:RibD family protein [Falsirhodobacter halotolerans]
MANRDGGDRRVSGPTGRIYGPLAGRGGAFVLAQVGQSLDGRVATEGGDARDISGPAGLAHLHRLRALSDAVIVGAGTVTADDPRLSVRLVDGPDPVRVIIDCHATVPDTAGIFHDGGAPVFIVTCATSSRTYPAGVTVLPLSQAENGLDPRDILAALAAHGLHRILVEGGARTIARFMTAGCLDRLHVTVAPLIIGAGPAGLSLPPVASLTAAQRPTMEVHDLGGDILFDCALRP